MTEQNTLEIITVSNGNSDYAGNFTPKEIDIINSGDIRVDFSMPEATINDDVFEYLKRCKEIIDTIVLDPPYNDKFADKYQKAGNTPDQFIISANTPKTTLLFNHIKRLNPKIIIIKSWSYFVIEGYRLRKGYLCYAGGYRKPTILLILEKMTSKIYFKKEVLQQQVIKKISEY